MEVQTCCTLEVFTMEGMGRGSLTESVSQLSLVAFGKVGGSGALDDGSNCAGDVGSINGRRVGIGDAKHGWRRCAGWQLKTKEVLAVVATSRGKENLRKIVVCGPLREIGA